MDQTGNGIPDNELIHGKPDKIASTVKNLRDFQKAFDLVGGGMKKLDSSNWKGEAANAFREKFETLPTDWLRAADAFEEAAKALETYSKAITSAQGKAREAIALYKEGDKDTETAKAEYKKKADAYDAARNSDTPLPHPGNPSDPGKSKRARAQEILADARRAQRSSPVVTRRSASRSSACARRSPAIPSWTLSMASATRDTGPVPSPST